MMFYYFFSSVAAALSIIIIAAFYEINEVLCNNPSINASEFLFMYPKLDFFLIDALAVLISVPLSIVLKFTATGIINRVITPTPAKIFNPYCSMKYL